MYQNCQNDSGVWCVWELLIQAILGRTRIVWEFFTCRLNEALSQVLCCHGLSQQGIWVPFWTPKPLKRTSQDTQTFLCGISKNPNLKLIIEFFHLLIIPMTLFNDIMPYFDEFIQVYGWNMSILWSPFKNWAPKNFTTANFRHPVSKSWLRHCLPQCIRYFRKKWILAAEYLTNSVIQLASEK